MVRAEAGAALPRKRLPAGGLTLEALRQKIGSRAFFKLLSRWAAENAHGNVSTDDFTALAEAVSGEDLDHFFHVWLDRPRWPHDW